MNKRFREILAMTLLGLCGLCVSVGALAQDQNVCQGFAPLPPGGDFGLDYRIKTPDNLHFLKMVEDYHFTPQVEQLVSGSTGSILGDLSYVLRRYPNHHRALYALIRHHRASPEKFQFPPECHLRRAAALYPRDSSVRILYGIYLHQDDRFQEALEQYQVGLDLFERSAELHYNLGLLYVDLENYPKAREHARRAYDLGYQLPGLRRKLEAVDYWP